MSSVRFENAHQRAGLNRVGKYYKTVPEKGPEHSSGLRAPTTNEPWRRWTGIVGADENRLSWKQRKRGLRRLLKQIEMRIVAHASGLRSPANSATARASRRHALQWDTELGNWSRTQSAGRTLESICVEFGMSRGQLNALTREFNSMGAQDVIDGYKIRGLRKSLVGQLREAAFALWGPPGEFAQKRCMNVCHGQPAVGCPCGSRESVGPAGNCRGASRATTAHFGTEKGGRRRCPWHTNSGAKSPAHYPKRSKYFRKRPAEFFGLLPGDEERIRLSELLGKLDALRDENDWGGENLAIQLGFENAAALKRACLNVMGRKIEQLERILAREIVEYYLAAEDRELRRIATAAEGNYGRDGNNVIYAAREIYCGDADIVPEEPFLDRWSACEFAKPEWLAEMRKELG